VNYSKPQAKLTGSPAARGAEESGRDREEEQFWDSPALLDTNHEMFRSHLSYQDVSLSRILNDDILEGRLTMKVKSNVKAGNGSNTCETCTMVKILTPEQ
jgi:hypothetical protein